MLMPTAGTRILGEVWSRMGDPHVVSVMLTAAMRFISMVRAEYAQSHALRDSLRVQFAETQAVNSLLRGTFVQMHVWLVETQDDLGRRSAMQSCWKGC